jgi:putative transcriptional regulator
MSKTDITRVTVKRGEAQTRGSTDWKRIDAMTDERRLPTRVTTPMHSR